jgi:hypothetical protein
MAKGVQDLGNGLGYVYMTEPDGATITSVATNNLAGARQFKINGTLVAPIASNKSSYGIIEFTSIIGPGDISGVAVNGTDQIPTPITVTGLTTDQVADAVANAINGFTPTTGYDYTAVSAGSFVYVFAPPFAGATPNGYAIVVATAPGGVLTYDTTSFAYGADSAGVYDTVFGSRFFLNADYGPLGISGELPADPTSLTNSVEITKYYVTRGQQLGIFVKNITEQANGLYGIDRSGFMTKVIVTPNVGSTATIVKINPEDFVDGDIVFLQPSNPLDTLTVESAPAVTVPTVGNIYLTNDTPWVSSKYNVLMLQYKYISGTGAVFTELFRSMATPPDIYIGKTLYVSNVGVDASAIPYNLNHHYLTITAAKAAAVAGDTIYVCPGIYNEGNFYKDGVNFHFLNGAIVNLPAGQNAFAVSDNGTCNVSGDAHFTGSAIALYTTGTSCVVNFECKSIDTVSNAFFLQNGTIYATVKDYVKSEAICLNVRSGNADVVFSAKSLIHTGTPASFGFANGCFLGGYNHTGRVFVSVDEMTQTVGGGNMIMVTGNSGAIYIKCPKVVNNFSGFATVSLFLSNIQNFFKFEGNIFSGSIGSLAAGVWCSVQDNQTNTWNQYVEIVGDIWVDTNYAMYVHNGPTKLKYTGNIYGNTDGTQLVNSTWPSAIPNGGSVNLVSLIYCAMNVTSSSPSPATYWSIWLKNVTLNQFAAGGNCIYKKQAYLFPGPVETSQYLQLDGVTMFTVDGGSGTSIDGDFAAVNNEVHINAVVSNSPVSANITEVGGTITNDATLESYSNSAYLNW